MNITKLWNKAAEATEDNSWESQVAFMQRFAELVAAHEREECAKVCEEMAYTMPQRHQFAYAIRERGKA